MKDIQIILASASPRRAELLALLVNDFKIVVSEFDESMVPAELSPSQQVQYSAQMKASWVARLYPNDVVVGADTIVVCENEILGKPQNPADAERMLKMLSGRSHYVYSGVSVHCDEKSRSAVVCTEVFFGEISDDAIKCYVRSGEPLDKAGAYGIQGLGSAFVQKIDGCYFNVVGLPVYRLSELFRELSIPTYLY